MNGPEGINSVVGQMEAELSRGFREDGVVSVEIRGIDAGSIRTFFSNLLITPNIDELDHDGLLIKDPLVDLYRRFQTNKEARGYVQMEKHTLSRADIDFILGLARNRVLDKYKTGVGAGFIKRLGVLAKDHDEALRRKKLDDLVNGDKK